VGSLLTDSSASDELKNVLVKANRAMDELQVTATNLQHAMVNVRLASTNLPAISEAIGNEAKELPGLVLQTQTSMRELERLTEAMQRHWLLRKLVNKTNPPSLRPLPASEEPERKPVKAFRSPRESTR
jgi:molybdopterin-biosynthesis enzyme MoeA-like protein